MVTITDFELFKIPPRWLFLKIETSDGLVGWGEPIVEGRANTVRAAVKELMDGYILGEDPHQIEDHWQIMYRGGFHRGGPILMSALAGIDQALWDIKGKYCGEPIYRLIGGGAREQIRIYQNIISEDTDEIVNLATDAVSEGYTAIKLYPASQSSQIETPEGLETIDQRVGAAREAVGLGIDIGVDLHGRISKLMIPRLLSRFEVHDLMFIEEPVRPEYAYILDDTDQYSTPIAMGERLYSRWDFRPHFERDRIDIAQPDLSHAGGITEVRRIASMAETYGVSLAANCSVGPIAFTACLQISAHASSAAILPAVDERYTTTYLHNSEELRHENGYVDIPSEPGLGVDIDEEAVRERSGTTGDWRTPIWRHDDRSLAEW